MISVIVITKNEEEMLAACLESVKWVDEIIVADNESTDDTVKIAKRYTDQIVHVTGKDFSRIRNESITKAKGDWVLYVDADERVLESLKDEIQDLMQTTDKAAFAIPRRNIIFGEEVKYAAFWPDYMIRLLRKKDFKTWVGKIHEHATFEGELGYTQNPFLHLTHRSLDQNIMKSLNWSHFDAQLRLAANHPRMTSWRFIRLLITETWKQGVVRRGFFGGTVGTMDALLQTFSLLFTYMRLWELQQPKPLNEKYQEIDKKLKNNSFKF